MKKLWQKFHSSRSSESLSGSTGQWSPVDSNSRASTNDETVSNTVRAMGVVALAPIGVRVPPISQGLQPTTVTVRELPASTDKDQPSNPGTNVSSPPENKPRWTATAYSGIKMGLEVVRESSDVFVPLKSVVGGLSALLKQYDQFIANKADVQRLIGRVESLITSLIGSPRENDIKEIERRRVLERDLKKVLDALDPMLNQSKFSGFLNNVDQSAVITGVVEDIRDAIIDYQTSLQQGLNDNTMTMMESVLFDKLPRAKGARYESGNREKCLRGTRVKLLETIENWVHQHRNYRVYWLNGIAGTGKTTIAQTFAERMFADGLLGASFFCSRDFPDRRNLHFIFPTLAFQLAYKYPSFRAHLVQLLTINPDVGHESLSNQLVKLLVEPLRSTGLSTVIIIDALDECEDEQPASAVLSLLSREISQIPLVKFFITGRPESRLRKGFRLPALRPRTEVLLLHEVERGNVDEDIKLFLEYHLRELVKDRSDIDVTIPWPTQEDIRIVTFKAGGLFIYASTVVKFLDSETHTPQERLWLITSMPHSSVYEGQSGIDPLYTCVFEKGCAHVHGGDLSFFSRLLLVIGSVVLLYEPISVANLAKLLDIGPKDIFTPIRSLHSVILVPEADSKPIRVFHKSFPDYITDHERCKDARFYVDSPVHHARLVIRCFGLMKTALKKNICDLPQYAMNGDIEDLSVRQQESVGGALMYACRFWARHLCSTSHTGGDAAQILQLLKKFIQCQLLQWLEVLSVVKDLRGAIHSLIDVERWLLEVSASDEALLNSIRECRRFILYSFDGIEQSAAHIYDSALLWPPTSSLVRTLYQGQLRTRARLLNGIDHSWDACIRAIHLGDSTDVSSVVFSHRGNLIAGCNGPIVKILEAATGVCLATLIEHDNDVLSVAFSSDDVFLASGSRDFIVMVWDVQTGASITKLKGHGGEVNSVAFSPTGTAVASGADDKTIRIWDFSSGHCNRILEGHTSWVISICWLQADKVVSGCGGGKVKIWDVSSGECLKTFNEHSGTVFSVASSPDASTIASGSRGNTIRVYDAETGGVLHTVMADNVVYSINFSPDADKIVYATLTSIVVWDLAKGVPTFKWQSGSPFVSFSPDGSCVAAGSWDGFMTVFQINTTVENGDVCNRHSSGVRCISCSADGRMIASGSEDTTVRIWDAATSSCLHTLRGHSNWIRSVAFSPDSSLIASASSDCTIRICSLHDYSEIATLKEHRSSGYGVKFSPDSRRMVSVSRFQEIILWDVEKWEKLAYLPSPTRKPLLDLQVSFSTDGALIILELRGTVKRWIIHPSAEYPSGYTTTESPNSNASSGAVSLPMVLVPIPDDVHGTLFDEVGAYRHPVGSEWVIDRDNRRVCWIPADRRVCSDFHGNKLILGTTSGKFVIVDLSDTSAP